MIRECATRNNKKSRRSPISRRPPPQTNSVGPLKGTSGILKVEQEEIVVTTFSVTDTEDTKQKTDHNSHPNND